MSTYEQDGAEARRIASVIPFYPFHGESPPPPAGAAFAALITVVL